MGIIWFKWCWKTTLLNILNAYDSITSGNIVLFGMTPGMVGYSADNVRQHIGFISNKLTNQFQDGEHVGVVLMAILNLLAYTKHSIINN